jgi:hypothetical protein
MTKVVLILKEVQVSVDLTNIVQYKSILGKRKYYQGFCAVVLGKLYNVEIRIVVST